ncbi:P-loop containing nucleoside triphosphate hydrolase protein [Infundibulicybe gibba]|nr:P-loop containing nucleoside triphosphate hydrolase protein [Infundibulicybe gibba]
MATNDRSLQTLAAPLTQTAGSLVGKQQKVTTGFQAVDKLLGGGLQRSHMLEISGPPGSPKNRIAVNVVRAFAEAGEHVVFVDTQNMMSLAMLRSSLRLAGESSLNLSQYVSHVDIHTLLDLMMFIQNLPSLLQSHKVALLVLNSISFPFQSLPKISHSAKAHILERIKQELAVASMSKGLTVVSTSQLATKLLNADGSPGTFNTSAKGVLVPQLAPSYLPSAKAHRVILIPNGRKSGFAKLLSSPTYRSELGPAPQEPYSLVSFLLSSCMVYCDIVQI